MFINHVIRDDGIEDFYMGRWGLTSTQRGAWAKQWKLCWEFAH